MKKTVALLITLMLVLMCTACGGETTKAAPEAENEASSEVENAVDIDSLTPDEIVEKMLEAVNGTTCTVSKVNAGMGVFLGIEYLGQEINSDISVTSDVDVEICLDPIGMRSTQVTITTLTGMGSDTVESNEYTVIEDGELVTYKNEGNGWFKTASEYGEEDILGYTSFSDFDIFNARIDHDAAPEYNGIPAVRIICNVENNEVVDSLISGIVGEDISSADIDLSQIDCESYIYVDRATFLPIHQETVVTGLNSILVPMLTESVGLDGANVTIDSSDLLIFADYLSYESADEIIVPEEVLAEVG